MLFLASALASLSTTERVAAAETAMIAREGRLHVEGRYFADEGSAARQRRTAAERQVAAAERREQWLARQIDGAQVQNGQQLVRRALSATRAAIGAPLTPEQVTGVVTTARALWHAAQSAAQGTTAAQQAA